MKNEWRKVRLGDVVNLNYGKSLPKRERVTGKYPVYGSSGMVDCHVIPYVKSEGIIVGRKGNVGSIYYEKNPFYPIDTVFYIDKTKIQTDLKYLYFLLKTLNLSSLNSDAAVPGLNRNQALKVKIQIPDFFTQVCIASIISTYDNLIENNEKRIKILEEMAQRLYTQWFVKFEFPVNPRHSRESGNPDWISNQVGDDKKGYKSSGGKLVESGTEYGMIPKGWEVKKLKDIGLVITGKTPSKSVKENYGNEILFIKTPDFEGNVFIKNTSEKLSTTGADTQNNKMLPPKTVMVSTIGTLGKVAITSCLSTTNQQINSLLTNNPDDYIYFYFFAKTLKSRLKGLGSNGATMGNVSKSKFESITILYPTESVRSEFFQITKNNFEDVLTLESKQIRLIDIRDLLIENLVTGKILIKN